MLLKMFTLGYQAVLILGREKCSVFHILININSEQSLSLSFRSNHLEVFINIEHNTDDNFGV